MPFCSQTYLASDWYWTLIAQIDLWLSNRLVNINHLNLPRQIFSSVFCSRQKIKCQVWKKSVLWYPFFSVKPTNVLASKSCKESVIRHSGSRSDWLIAILKTPMVPHRQMVQEGRFNYASPDVPQAVRWRQAEVERYQRVGKWGWCPQAAQGWPWWWWQWRYIWKKQS